MIEDEFGDIDYDESGEGPTIVLVPGSCSTGAAWRPIVAQWENGFRCVTTSLLGYGGTVERRTALDAGIAHEAEVLEAVIRRAAAPVHLVGHSFGGLSALAVALRKRVLLLSLTIAEAPAPEILRNMGEHRHYLAFRKMSEAYFRSFQAGETAAIEQMIDSGESDEGTRRGGPLHWKWHIRGAADRPPPNEPTAIPRWPRRSRRIRPGSPSALAGRRASAAPSRHS